ncbi:MAG: four helix bundle protein [Candidatus Pacebacteria bacterium]|nr:four helix bundle protein [Candidatus Paceibacterota bacterium]
MAKEIGLPVYKASYDLLLYSFQLIKNMPKDYKYTIGDKIKNEMVDMIMNIYHANKEKDKELKKERIIKAKNSIEVIQLLFRLLHDLRQIGLKKFTQASVKIDCVSRQLSGWAKNHEILHSATLRSE